MNAFEQGFMDKLAEKMSGSQLVQTRNLLNQKRITPEASKRLNSKLLAKRIKDGLVKGQARAAKNMTTGSSMLNTGHYQKGVADQIMKDQSGKYYSTSPKDRHGYSMSAKWERMNLPGHRRPFVKTRPKVTTTTRKKSLFSW